MSKGDYNTVRYIGLSTAPALAWHDCMNNKAGQTKARTRRVETLKTEMEAVWSRSGWAMSNSIIFKSGKQRQLSNGHEDGICHQLARWMWTKQFHGPLAWLQGCGGLDGATVSITGAKGA